MIKPKIFGIGLAKTGTTSLNDAFAILNISSIGCPASISSIKRFDAATDGIVADQPAMFGTGYQSFIRLSEAGRHE